MMVGLRRLQLFSFYDNISRVAYKMHTVSIITLKFTIPAA